MKRYLVTKEPREEKYADLVRLRRKGAIPVRIDCGTSFNAIRAAQAAALYYGKKWGVELVTWRLKDGGVIVARRDYLD